VIENVSLNKQDQLHLPVQRSRTATRQPAIPSSRSFALVIMWPARLVAVHLYSPSSVNAVWWMTRELASLSTVTRIRLVLNISKLSLYHTTFGVGIPWK